MADDMEKNKQHGGQFGQGQSQQGQHGQGQKSEQTGQTGQTGQQQKGNVDPSRKNPTQDDELEEQDRQRRAS